VTVVSATTRGERARGPFPRRGRASRFYCGLVLFSQACFIASWDIPVFCAFSCVMQSLMLFALLDEEDCDPDDEELLLL
jgi:hypothetical protein